MNTIYLKMITYNYFIRRFIIKKKNTTMNVPIRLFLFFNLKYLNRFLKNLQNDKNLRDTNKRFFGQNDAIFSKNKPIFQLSTLSHIYTPNIATVFRFFNCIIFIFVFTNFKLISCKKF